MPSTLQRIRHRVTRGEYEVSGHAELQLEEDDFTVDDLLAGEYEWSAISKHLRTKGLVRS